MDRNGGGAKKFSGAAMILGIPKETFPGERRVAIVPTLAKNYQKLGLDILVETGAGEAAGFPDS
ncbi:MAG: NAD(P)(+) transhydrogenase (Re/Si-specific) subunit alpha, partial [Candidatus Omnitrophica bacterium]|nr:NAD(P)(+) transhydrogenase (Re/Si-specific) subunit alpha [Candidatus Omnitrophota bacterium]